MKTITLVVAILLANLSWASNDRTEIHQAMQCFFQWDLNGGTAEEAQKCILENVQYQRIVDGNLDIGSPGLEFKGKGADAHRFNILNIDIYNDVAFVNALLRYNPGPEESPYVKTFVLYKLKQGWRVTNVLWGKPTPEK